MELDEPDSQDIVRAVKTLKLVLTLVNQDPLAKGAQAMVEATLGVDLSNELVHWLRDPKEKVEIRNEVIKKMRSIWLR